MYCIFQRIKVTTVESHLSRPRLSGFLIIWTLLSSHWTLDDNPGYPSIEVAGNLLRLENGGVDSYTNAIADPFNITILFYDKTP